MDETIPSISRYPPVEVHRDPSTGMTWFAGRLRENRNRQSALASSSAAADASTPVAPPADGLFTEDLPSVPKKIQSASIWSMFSRETGSECPSPSRSWLAGRFMPRGGESLAGGELLEDEAGAIALPTHDRVGLVEVASVLQAALTEETC